VTHDGADPAPANNRVIAQMRGGGRVDLVWDALPATLPPTSKLARLTAWVLAAERAARPFALRIPGVALPAGQGRDHRRAALTALALLPEQAS